MKNILFALLFVSFGTSAAPTPDSTDKWLSVGALIGTNINLTSGISQVQFAGGVTLVYESQIFNYVNFRGDLLYHSDSKIGGKFLSIPLFLFHRYPIDEMFLISFMAGPDVVITLSKDNSLLKPLFLNIEFGVGLELVSSDEWVGVLDFRYRVGVVNYSKTNGGLVTVKRLHALRILLGARYYF